ncbi:SpoIIE family protein phosphatase [Thalassotalea ganghwensis]
MNALNKLHTKLAMVVDDSPVQRKVLSKLLVEEGYRVCTAVDGANAVYIYQQEKPDLVLMDINMPVMNGYQAATRIKALSVNSLCPMVFITSMNTDQAFIDAIDAGGDGILVRPFSPEVFKAKIKSIQRLSDMFMQLKYLQQAQQKDAELAEQLMSGVIEARNYARERIGILKKPAELFSGDIQLTSLSPNGNINVLLGDFTGHGLRSSIGAIPLAETFRTMTKKGFSLLEIVKQVNRQLTDLLPADLFLAAAFVSVSSHENSAYIFNAGLPDCYLFDALGNIKTKVVSKHPPIGVLPALLPDSSIDVINVANDDHLLLLSDGIVEARNCAGEMYDFERFERAVKQGILNNDICNTVLVSVNAFCQGMTQEDDISLISIPCGGWQTSHISRQETKIKSSEPSYLESLEPTHHNEKPEWTWRLLLTGKKLAKVNPIPMAINQIHDIENNDQHWQNLYTVLTELFVNALDHGVLGLSSELKDSAQGFAQYFAEREQRLSTLDSGFIDMSLAYFALNEGGKVKLTFKDSGQGFNYQKMMQEVPNNIANENKLSGRGIGLIKQLCSDLHYSDKGSKVEACYVW